MSKVNAVILAGAPADAGMNPGGEPISRAMIDIGGKTMLQWMVDALRKSASLGKIVAVGNVQAGGLDAVIQPGESLMDNMKKGIDTLESDEPVLILSSDIPLITAESVEDFLNRAMALDVDLAYPIIPKTYCEKRYPELKRTYLKTANGVFTGGNIMLVRPEFVENNWETIASTYAARKHVLKLARIVGVDVLLRVLLAQLMPSVLKISMLERAVSRMLDAEVRAVVSAYPEIGEDVDKPSDLEVVRRIMSVSK